jgi:hypothetical protein
MGLARARHMRILSGRSIHKRVSSPGKDTSFGSVRLARALDRIMPIAAPAAHSQQQTPVFISRVYVAASLDQRVELHRRAAPDQSRPGFGTVTRTEREAALAGELPEEFAALNRCGSMECWWGEGITKSLPLGASPLSAQSGLEVRIGCHLPFRTFWDSKKLSR